MNVLIACKNLQREIGRMMELTGCDWPVIWLEEGLHAVPKKLHRELQTQLDSLTGVNSAVLGFGFCGNALVGLTPPNGTSLVFPRADDCITLCLGSQERRRGFGAHSYFLIQSWVESGQNMWCEYEDAVQEYGKETADEIYEMMLAGYDQLVVVDTHSCETGELVARTQPMAAQFQLRHTLVEGDTGLLRKLLTGQWGDESIIVISPGRKVELRDIFPPES